MVKSAPKFQTVNPQEYWIEERIFVQEAMNHPGLPEVSLATCRVPAGVTTQLHALSVNETYVIRRGAGKMEKDGAAPFDVGPGDCVHIPAGVAQRISNSGDDDLIFDVICTPRFESKCYTALE